MKYKNEAFYVQGSKTLKKALIEELVGLKYKHSGTRRNTGVLAIYPNLAIYQFLDSLGATHSLPEQWDLVLKLASEKEEEKEESLEYVKCTSTSTFEYTYGKVYKVEKGRRVRNDKGYLPEKPLPLNLKSYYNTYDFIPAVKKEFDEWEISEKITDEKELKSLISLYSKEGIKEGVWMEANGEPAGSQIRAFALTKNVELFKHPQVKIGSSALAWQNQNGLWYTADSNFTPVKEIKIGGHTVKKEGEFVKVGCQKYNRDAIVLIRNILFPNGKNNEEQTFYSSAHGGNITLSFDELNRILALNE